MPDQDWYEPINGRAVTDCTHPDRWFRRWLRGLLWRLLGDDEVLTEVMSTRKFIQHVAIDLHTDLELLRKEVKAMADQNAQAMADLNTKMSALQAAEGSLEGLAQEIITDFGSLAQIIADLKAAAASAGNSDISAQVETAASTVDSLTQKFTALGNSMLAAAQAANPPATTAAAPAPAAPASGS